MDLFGRRTETATLDGLLAQAADGAGCGLVLWGEPGIGKSALLDYAVDAAAESWLSASPLGSALVSARAAPVSLV